MSFNCIIGKLNVAGCVHLCFSGKLLCTERIISKESRGKISISTEIILQTGGEDLGKFFLRFFFIAVLGSQEN